MAKTIRVPKFGEILTKRPENMGFAEYKQKLKEQNRRLKGYNLTVGIQYGRRQLNHIAGRLEGVLIPAKEWTNSREVQVVVR